MTKKQRFFITQDPPATHTHTGFLPSHEYNHKAEALSLISTEAIDCTAPACRGPLPWSGTWKYDNDPLGHTKIP